VAPKYRIAVERRAEEWIALQQAHVQERLKEAVEGLASDPWPRGSKKLARYDDLYTIRVGDYRTIYTVDVDRHVVAVVDAGPRQSIYKRYS
jgi:mRNA-degrading endonuclease RelE of RelBE toxin-antitoxin system